MAKKRSTKRNVMQGPVNGDMSGAPLMNNALAQLRQQTAAQSQPQPQASRPQVAMTPSMVVAIKSSPKGKIPPGLARYLAAHKKGK